MVGLVLTSVTCSTSFLANISNIFQHSFLQFPHYSYFSCYGVQIMEKPPPPPHHPIMENEDLWPSPGWHYCLARRSYYRPRRMGIPALVPPLSEPAPGWRHGQAPSCHQSLEFVIELARYYKR